MSTGTAFVEGSVAVSVAAVTGVVSMVLPSGASSSWYPALGSAAGALAYDYATKEAFVVSPPSSAWQRGGATALGAAVGSYLGNGARSVPEVAAAAGAGLVGDLIGRSAATGIMSGLLGAAVALQNPLANL